MIFQGTIQDKWKDCFLVMLQDSTGNISGAELPFDKIQESESPLAKIGAGFTFDTDTKKISFDAPFIWTEEMEAASKKTMDELFPKDLFND